jgi:hypothetical protein
MDLVLFVLASFACPAAVGELAFAAVMELASLGLAASASEDLASCDLGASFQELADPVAFLHAWADPERNHASADSG